MSNSKPIKLRPDSFPREQARDLIEDQLVVIMERSGCSREEALAALTNRMNEGPRYEGRQEVRE